MAQRALLVIFAKAPISGEVNTRLIPDIGVEAATRLQAELIDIRMQQFGHVAEYDVQLWCSPDTHHPVFQQCMRDNRIELHQQLGCDLGARIVHALGSGFSRYHRVVLIGTDAPAIDHAIVSRAISDLDTCDVVIAPAEDGGYVLIGMRGFYKNVFLSVPWGTSNVMRKTRGNIVAQALKYHELETSWDIDRAEDYQRYANTFKT